MIFLVLLVERSDATDRQMVSDPAGTSAVVPFSHEAVLDRQPDYWLPQLGK